MQTMEGLTQAERQRLTSYLTETHDQVVQTARAFSAEQLDFKSAPDRWSISEKVEHLTIIHNLVLSYVRQVLAAPASPKESVWKGRDDAMLGQRRSRLTPLKVPEIGWPRNQWKHQELFRRFRTFATV